MTTQALVNLVVNADGAQDDLFRQLRAIVSRAEATAPDIDLNVRVDENGRLRDARGRFVAAGNAAAQTRGEVDGLSGSFGTFASAVLGAVGPLARFGLIGSAAISQVLPLAAGLATTLTNLAPAAAAGVTGLVAMQGASTTLKIALLGVSDAIGAVFDPDADPAKVAEALKNLSTNARSFVLELQEMKPAFDRVRLDVQDQLFEGLDASLKNTANATLPDIIEATRSFATTFNTMARDTARQGAQLGRSGALGTALIGATSAFRELQSVPGDVLTAVVHLAGAGGPLLNRFTSSIAEVADSLSNRLSRAAESGALEAAVNRAGDLLVQLGGIGLNVGEILGNIFSGFDDAGGGLINSLDQITTTLANFTGTSEFQDALADISDVGSTLVATVLPLLTAALSGLFPVLDVLSPLVQEIVTALGTELARIIPELSPVLTEMAVALQAVWTAAAPLLPVLGDLAVEVLPELIPLFVQLADLFTELSPLIYYVAQGLSMFVVPAVAQLVGMLVTFNGIMFDVVEAFVDTGESVAQFARVNLYGILIPALQAVGSLLSGDFSGAWRHAQDVIAGFRDNSTGSVRSATSSWISSIRGAGSEIVSNTENSFGRMVSSARSHLADVGALLRAAPANFRSALGDLNSLLYNAGRSLIAGLIRGIRSQLSAVASAASSIVSEARDFFPFSPARRGPFSGRGYSLYSGRKLVEDFAKGITQRGGRVTEALYYAMQGSRDARGIAPLLSSSGSSTALSSTPAVTRLTSSDFFARTNPVVNVFLGNERFQGYVQTVVDGSLDDFNRQASQGVRP